MKGTKKVICSGVVIFGGKEGLFGWCGGEWASVKWVHLD